jgi:hypothetical protein
MVCAVMILQVTVKERKRECHKEKREIWAQQNLGKAQFIGIVCSPFWVRKVLGIICNAQTYRQIRSVTRISNSTQF